jgi:ATP-dependent DNA ligase
VAYTEANELLQFVKDNDLEGVVAKLISAPYDRSIPHNWVKIINPDYTQYKDRWKWFKDRS